MRVYCEFPERGTIAPNAAYRILEFGQGARPPPQAA